MIKALGKTHGVDGQFDIHIAFDLPPAGGIGEFLRRLRHHRKAVVIQPGVSAVIKPTVDSIRSQFDMLTTA